MKKIKVITPGKLMLLGEHAVVYGYPCLVTAVDRYLTVGVEERKANHDRIITSEPAGRGYIEGIINGFRQKYPRQGKLTVTVTSQLTGYGLGSSAALTIGLVKALNEFWEIKLTDQAIFNFSLSLVQGKFPLASGFDLAACLYGGTLLFNGRSKKAEKIPTPDFPLAVVFSGKKVLTEDFVNKVKRLKGKNPQLVNHLFADIGEVVSKGKVAIENSDWAGLGKLMNRNQQDLVKLGVSTEKIDMIIKKSLEKGAFGAKLSGAGGGDCVLVLFPEGKKATFREVVNQSGGEILDLGFGATGAKIC